MRADTVYSSLRKSRYESWNVLPSILPYSGNEANYQRRQAFLKKQKKLPNYSQQCRHFKHSDNFKAIGTGKGQAVLKKLDEAWSSFWTLKRLQSEEGRLPPNIRRVRMPSYLKDRDSKQTVVRGFYVRNDCYRLDRKRSTITIIGKNLRLRYAADRVREGKKGRLDVMYDRLKDAWYAFIPVDTAPAKQAVVSGQPEKVGSIDLGICNLVAFYAENEQPVIYSGRAVLSDYVYRTKKIAELQSRLPQKQQHTSRKIGLSYRKRTRRFKHATRAMLKDLFERMKQIGITKVAVGDLNGIRDGNNLGAHTNQKLHNFWSHLQTIEWIRHMCEDYSMEFVQVSEKGTSKTCCVCAVKDIMAGYIEACTSAKKTG
ncbi:transposase, IS605 OrfB family [Candidatus Nitrososphaera gargensis Ga9.2]|uniref:Transposase, IS605 OrfB family n=1 Tax=Nitrososphaera gargensis (strain Ga9.2) TaxID=1237085 RepID=K0IGE1_NITGG|nr:RNA-guided endonuclease TnpB family protein [Candidatus Nitrososphaera gargensis]AFU57898.1 transposase, IS605 OrfB family [Candidatus Nitrososphaera gargensis Ga9.2]